MYVIGDESDEVNEYDLSTPWDISTASSLQPFSIGAQDITPEGLFFKPDGTKMYVIGRSSDAVHEYDLSTPRDVTTAVFLQTFSVSGQTGVPTGIFFKPDGRKMYVTAHAPRVHEYDLSSPWKAANASFLQTFSVSSQEATPRGNFFKSDGTKMYVIGNVSGGGVNEYDLSTPWDGTTAFSVREFAVSAQFGNPSGHFLKPYGPTK